MKTEYCHLEEAGCASAFGAELSSAAGVRCRCRLRRASQYGAGFTLGGLEMNERGERTKRGMLRVDRVGDRRC
jgi:hypothetical protein